MNKELLEMPKGAIKVYYLLREKDNKPITYKEISENLKMMKHYVFAMIGQLENKGFITKIKGYPNRYKINK